MGIMSIFVSNVRFPSYMKCCKCTKTVTITTLQQNSRQVLHATAIKLTREIAVNSKNL